MAMVGVDSGNLTGGLSAQVVWLGLRVGGRLAPFYIQNQANSGNGSAMMIAP